MPPHPVTGHFQQRRGWITYPGRGWRRVLVRMPLLYWRLGLKPLLVRTRLFRFLVLTTKGRRSGQTRHTMLTHFVLDGRIYIGAGWGERTQWYQNILADAANGAGILSGARRPETRGESLGRTHRQNAR